jgi:predicted MFS family arabinose efflux permease
VADEVASHRGAGSPVRVLRNRNFSLLWTGSVAAAFGSSIGGVVFTWVVFTATHSPLAIALLGVVGILPTVIFGILAGGLIDRSDRRRLMVGCDVARMVTLGTLAAYAWLFGVSVAVLLLAAFLVATFSTIFRPATNAAIPRLLEAEDVTDGNGLLLAGTTLASFVGSPIGGLVVVVLGVVLGFAVNAVTFGFSAALISLMVIPRLPTVSTEGGVSRPSFLSEVREGLAYLASQRVLLWVTLSGMAANFFLSIFGQFQVIFVAERLGLGAASFGIILAANAGGFGVGGLLAGRVGVDRAPGLWFAGAWAVSGFAVIGVGLSSTLLEAALLTVTFGILGGLGNTTFFAATQRTVPPRLLGRYFAIDEAGSFAMIPAGQIAGGFLVLAIGVSASFIFAGIGTVLVCAVLFAIPSVRHWGRPVPVAA